MLIVDIDKLFQKYVAENLKLIKGTVNQDNLDEKKEELYSAFFSTTFSELGGKTPLTFYKGVDNLVEILKEHFRLGVPVSEYLIDALIDGDTEDELLALLDETLPTDLLLIVIEVLEHKGSKKCVNGLIDLLFSDSTADSVKDSCVDMLVEFDIFDALIERLKTCKNPNGAVCELLSKQPKRSNVITDVLKRGLLNNLDSAPEYCSYIVEYGDESILDGLYEALQKVNDYVSFKEIGMAIEALGGTFDDKRDFSKDKNFIKIKEANKNERKDNN